jgi:hypothetical protein
MISDRKDELEADAAPAGPLPVLDPLAVRFAARARSRAWHVNFTRCGAGAQV